MKGQLLVLIFFLLTSCTDRLVTKKTFGRLGFSASGCFGDCSIMQVEIDNHKNYYFHGIKYTDKQGYYKGYLPDSLYQVLIKKLAKLKNHKLKLYPGQIIAPPLADGQQFKFKIMAKNGSEIKYEILEGEEELRDFLLESYKFVELTKVDTVAFLTKD